MQRRLGDARRAEALFLVTLTGIGLALVLAHYATWAFLRPAVTPASGHPALIFWLVQAVLLLSVIGLCVIGFKPGVQVVLRDDMLTLHQHARTVHLPLEAIDSIASVSALRVHRHYARYAATQIFANRHLDSFVLLTTSRGPVVVGLLPADQGRFIDLLSRRLTPAYDIPRSRVA